MSVKQPGKTLKSHPSLSVCFRSVSLDVCVGNCLYVGKSVRCAWGGWCVCLCVLCGAVSVKRVRHSIHISVEFRNG